jgi:hypothetical protein
VKVRAKVSEARSLKPDLLARVAGLRVYISPCSPFLITLSVMVIWRLLMDRLVLCSWPQVCKPFTEIRNALHGLVRAPNTLGAYAERMMWSVSASICIFGTLLVLILILSVLWKTASLSRGWRNAAFLGAGLVVLVLALGAMDLIPIRILDDPDMPALMFLHDGFANDFAGIRDWTVRLDKLGILTALLLGLAAAWLLVPLVKYRERWLAQTPDIGDHLRLILYCGAIVLVAHTLRAATLFTWSLAYVAEPGGANAPVLEDLRRFADAAVMGRGTVNTVFLAAIYLPAAISLGQLASSVESVGKESETWAVSLLRQSASLVAVLAPLLSGPIADLFRTFIAL